MEKAIETIRYRGFDIEIYQDNENVESPREWDNLGTMICFHNNYQLGDKNDYSDYTDLLQNLAEEADSTVADRIYHWEEGKGWARLSNCEDGVHIANNRIKTIIEKVIDKYYIMLPLYLYDHSSITMNTAGFNCPWDSGKVGLIYVSKEKAKKEYSWKILTKKREQEVIQRLIDEVVVYNQYISGDVYGYMVSEDSPASNKIECYSSCWSFFGDNHIISELLEHARSDIDYCIQIYKEKVTKKHHANALNRFYHNTFGLFI